MRNFRDMAENYQESAIELIQCKKEIEMCKNVQELNFEKVRIHTDDMNQIKIEIEKMKKSTTEYAEKVQINTEEIQKLKVENDKLKNHLKRLSSSGLRESNVFGLTDDSELLEQKYRDPDFFENSGASATWNIKMERPKRKFFQGVKMIFRATTRQRGS